MSLAPRAGNFRSATQLLVLFFVFFVFFLFLSVLVLLLFFLFFLLFLFFAFFVFLFRCWLLVAGCRPRHCRLCLALQRALSVAGQHSSMALSRHDLPHHGKPSSMTTTLIAVMPLALGRHSIGNMHPPHIT